MRRERINSRLRILQELIPNSKKVDIGTMSDEAVQYVKFLHMQIKVCVQPSLNLDGDQYNVSERENSDHSIAFQGPYFLLDFVDAQLLSSDELWMYSPLAYDSVNMGMHLNSSSLQE